MARILLISGNTRPGSLHTSALRTTARFAPGDLAVTLYQGLRDLPAFVPGEYAPPDPVTDLRHQVAGADAVLFSSPEFAGSIPGSLKNLFDWLVDGGDLGDKPVAWLSVAAPGQDDGARAALEAVLGHAGARMLPAACLRVPLDPATVDADGTVTDPQLHLALRDMLQVLARSLAARPRPAPSWQMHSSVYPVVPRTGNRPFQNWRAEIWRPAGQ